MFVPKHLCYSDLAKLKLSTNKVDKILVRVNSKFVNCSNAVVLERGSQGSQGSQ